MERKLSGLAPERVWYYFEELCRIPHGSGNTKQISDYCAGFAKEKGLRYVQDEVGNVIIFKDAAPGYEKAPAVIIQGHLDMVAEKTPESSHDFLKDPLDLFVEDGWVGAKDTTLGGDDGIAIAYALAVLEDESLPHPALECVFTVDEETGMDGAYALDMSVLQGKYLLNLDSEEEGTVLASCAGGLRKNCVLPVERQEMEGMAYRLEIAGLKGGHSGSEIDKERGNAVILMGRLLYEIGREMSMVICSMKGGLKDNAIPRLCEARILIKKGDEAELLRVVRSVETDLKGEFAVQDPEVSIVCEAEGEKTEKALTPASTTKVLFFLNSCPNGVQAMSHQIEGLVETSLNLGIMELTEEAFAAHFSIRSSVRSRKYMLCHKLEFICELLGGEAESTSEYPEWKFRADSHLRDVLCAVYEEQTGRKMEVQAIHAGLECGLFDDKKPGLDMISIGPDMRDIHTASERLSVPSVERIWNLLCEVLKRLDS